MQSRKRIVAAGMTGLLLTVMSIAAASPAEATSGPSLSYAQRLAVAQANLAGENVAVKAGGVIFD